MPLPLIYKLHESRNPVGLSLALWADACQAPVNAGLLACLLAEWVIYQEANSAFVIYEFLGTSCYSPEQDGKDTFLDIPGPGQESTSPGQLSMAGRSMQ